MLSSLILLRTEKKSFIGDIMTDTRDVARDKYWMIIPDTDTDVRYATRREAQQALWGFGGEGHILKAVAYVPRCEVIEIR